MPDSLIDILKQTYLDLCEGKDVRIKLHAIVRTCEERREAIRKSVDRVFSISDQLIGVHQ